MKGALGVLAFWGCMALMVIWPTWLLVGIGIVAAVSVSALIWGRVNDF